MRRWSSLYLLVFVRLSFGILGLPLGAALASEVAGAAATFGF